MSASLTVFLGRRREKFRRVHTCRRLRENRGAEQMFTGQTKVMWGILSAVGIAVLWALPFIGRKLVTRACGFVGYAAVLTVLSLCFGFEEIIRSFTRGGIIGGLGWSCMFLFGTIVNELFVRKKGVWIVLGVCLSAAGVARRTCIKTTTYFYGQF